jgi:hypothetical protein
MTMMTRMLAPHIPTVRSSTNVASVTLPQVIGGPLVAYLGWEQLLLLSAGGIRMVVVL